MDTDLLTADQAAAQLGVTKQTLYSYVSRGLVTSQPGSGPSRARLYSGESVRALVDARRVSGPERAAAQAMDWGLPVLESQLCLIHGGRFFYRGEDALDLSSTASIESVAALLWNTDQVDPPPAVSTGRSLGEVSSLIRWLAASDPSGLAGPHAPHETNTRHGATVVAHAFAAVGAGGDGPLADRLARVLGTDPDPIRQILVLCADHELNVSAFTARCVASTHASIEDSLLAALCAFRGARHGSASTLIQQMLDRLETEDRTTVIRETLAAHGSVPGFGHPLYPDGDPRTAVILDAIPAQRRTTAVRELASLISTELGTHPNLDFALAAFERAMGFSRGSGSTIFALGRCVGWIAHVLEAWDAGTLLRPRARYVGPSAVASEVARSPRTG